MVAGEDRSGSDPTPLPAPPAGFAVPTDEFGAIAIEAPCISCSYNLQGLTGLIVRCPECGRQNPIWIAVLPEHKVQRQMKLAETLPSACGGGLVVAGLVSLLFFTGNRRVVPFVGVVVGISLLVAAFAFYRFGRIATFPIARAIVWRFTAASVLILPGIVLGVSAVLTAGFKIFIVGFGLPWFNIAAMGLSSVVATVPGWLAYRSGRQKLKPFVREDLARQDAARAR